MATYVLLINWTDKGISSVKDTLKRSEDAKKLAERLGGRITGLHWTQGRYDLVATLDVPDEEAANAFCITLGMGGNIRTETLRAFSADDMKRILDKLP